VLDQYTHFTLVKANKFNQLTQTILDFDKFFIKTLVIWNSCVPEKLGIKKIYNSIRNNGIYSG